MSFILLTVVPILDKITAWEACFMTLESTRTIAKNRKAFHDYFILESHEAGIELKGSEVKSLRRGNVNLKDSWCLVVKEELFVNGMHIGAYDHGNIFNEDPIRVRKILLHKKEISKLYGQSKQNGFSIIPISIYFKRDKIKMQIGLCKGKKNYDKREVMKQRSAQRDMQRALRERNR